jgi:cysteine desulfurase
MYGPKGIGALYVRSGQPRIRIVQQMDGGGHERGLRSGTANVPAIVGFGKAAEIAGKEMADDTERTRTLRDRLVAGLNASLQDIRLNGHPTERLPNNANVVFRDADADAVMLDMRDVAVSSGSACSSASPDPSHVLRAIGLSESEARSALRFGLGRFNSEEEIDYAVSRVVEVVEKVRERRRRVGRKEVAASNSQ